jgi:hypothetical protein
MTTSRQVGAYYERRSKLFLERQGYLVEKARAFFIPGTFKAVHHDFFGVVDLIGIKRDHICLIQVKFLGLNSHLGTVRADLAALPAPPDTVYLHIWRKGASRPEIEGF